MSVPKKKQASGRTKRRRSHHKISTTPYKVAADGTIVPRHHATAEDLAKTAPNRAKTTPKK